MNKCTGNSSIYNSCIYLVKWEVVGKGASEGVLMSGMDRRCQCYRGE